MGGKLLLLFFSHFLFCPGQEQASRKALSCDNGVLTTCAVYISLWRSCTTCILESPTTMEVSAGSATLADVVPVGSSGAYFHVA